MGINVIGIIFKALFLGLTSLCLKLWFVDEMPNGETMVTAYPGLELPSQEWLALLPATLVAFFVYAMGFLAFMVHAVWQAPRLAATWPDFMERYRFIVGALRPNRWWWILIQLLFSLAIVLVRAMANGSVHVELYGITFVLLALCVLELIVQPYKFVITNKVSCTMNCSLLIFVITSTSLLDAITYDSAAEVELMRNLCAAVCVVLILGALAFALFGVGSSLLSQRAACPGAISAVAMRVAFEFRDVVAELSLLSDRDFLAALVRLGEVDMEMLRTAVCTVVAVFLQQQPATSFLRQRVMPGTPYQVWVPGTSAMRALRSALSGEAQATLEQSATCRLAVMKLADELRRMACAKMTPRRSTSVFGDVEASLARRERRASFWSHAGDAFATQTTRSFFAGLLKHRQHATVDCGEFCTLLAPICTLSDPELRSVYHFFDHNDGGAVPLCFALAALVAIAPHCAAEEAVHLCAEVRGSLAERENSATLLGQPQLGDEVEPGVPGGCETPVLENQPELPKGGQLPRPESHAEPPLPKPAVVAPTDMETTIGPGSGLSFRSPLPAKHTGDTVPEFEGSSEVRRSS
eukprot:NODE_201_length_1823_cov_273.823529.p1 GENE.NODE_201_length_1823_cov_273.823529~~NODE_201_length_1823_cov_273.823529.p1  ORF type:complete len:580 (+),score=145.42 NODE_201_length_1823_cov_273.823529:3-1742(+)